MKKNIIIYGTSRSGKTTLAEKINKKLLYNMFSIDSLVSAFQESFPELKINHFSRDGSVVKNLNKFLWMYINTSSSKTKRRRNINFVFEGSYFDIEDLTNPYYKEKFVIIVLLSIYNSPTEYFEILKKYDNENDWTFELKEKELMDYATNLYEDNIRLKAECESKGIRYYNTAIDRDNVLKNIIEFVQKEVEED